MNRKVLLIGENVSSFILNAIQDALKTNEYQVSSASMNVRELSLIEEKPDIFIVYADENIDRHSDSLIYLKDLCVEYERRLYLIGYNDELEQIQKIIPEDMINATFERPLNVKLLVEKMNEEVEKAELEEEKKHILIVDDSGTMLRTIKSWLSHRYKVSMANSGAMAITFLASNKPDLILLDYEMPICSGPQVMEMIHAETSTSDIPIMFLTAKGDRESVQKVLDLKPVGYLLKTMKPEEIVESIDKFFAKKSK